MRSIWKGIFISNVIRYHLYFNIEKNIILKRGNIRIFRGLLNYTFLIYNGKKYFEIIIQVNYINFFIGQFIFSRKLDNIHKKIKGTKKCRR